MNYSKEELISFGEYLLSDERRTRIIGQPENRPVGGVIDHAKINQLCKKVSEEDYQVWGAKDIANALNNAMRSGDFTVQAIHNDGSASTHYPSEKGYPGAVGIKGGQGDPGVNNASEMTESPVGLGDPLDVYWQNPGVPVEQISGPVDEAVLDNPPSEPPLSDILDEIGIDDDAGHPEAPFFEDPDQDSGVV